MRAPAALLCALLAAPIAQRPASAAAGLAREVGQGKPTVLHFWATWCGACREEFPRLRDTLLALQSHGVAVALVSIDRPADLAKVKQDLIRFKLTALPSILLDAPDPEVVARALGDEKFDGTLPSTVLFDSKGRRVRSFIGTTDPATLRAAVAQVRKN